ncbi:hypothetical protein CRG98_004268 [Punica granatum]|uniref:Uncharacterized protein n=1 Tax=Punica granatum TaxID=22663 RepID=A0A2I0L3R1_PUNGR|nr:hypothetical protein CRG98_004268 [Punica granatum]
MAGRRCHLTPTTQLEGRNPSRPAPLPSPICAPQYNLWEPLFPHGPHLLPGSGLPVYLLEGPMMTLNARLYCQAWLRPDDSYFSHSPWLSPQQANCTQEAALVSMEERAVPEHGSRLSGAPRGHG